MHNLYSAKIKEKGKSNYLCPLCGNSESEKIREFNSIDILKHLKINNSSNKYNLIKEKIERIWMQDKSYFVMCKKCSFHFAYPFVSGDNEFYSMVYDGGANYPEWKWDFEISFDRMSQLINQNSNNDYMMLEIGAGDGSFVKRISESLIESKNIVTTEFSNYGRKKISDLGILCTNVSLLELLNKGYENSFDFICMFQVLEHLDKIDVVFKTLFKLLKINGDLFITVPNNLHRLYFERMGIVEDIPPIHIGRWNLDNFRFVEKKYEMKIIDHQIQNGSFLGNVRKILNIKYRNAIKLNLFRPDANFKYIKYIRYLFLFVLNIKHITPLLSKNNMGVSQWVHFKRV